MDNFSRAILGYKASTVNSASNTTLLQKEIFSKYNLQLNRGSIICDDGSEFKGGFTEFVKQSGFTKLIAQKDILQSNSAIEALNKIVKYRFLYHQKFVSADQLIRYLPLMVESYQQIPKAILFGETPEAVLKGAIPDKDKYKNSIAQGRKNRITVNQNKPCCLQKLPILDG